MPGRQAVEKDLSRPTEVWSLSHTLSLNPARHGQVGQETSSRNSEVVHSGIYYPPDSLKTALCIRGRDLLYKRCRRDGIGHRQTGKLILATHENQVPYLRKLFDRSQQLRAAGTGDVPLEWLTGDQVRDLEPDLGRQVVGALLSRKTGIVSSHELMEHLEKSECGGRTQTSLVAGEPLCLSRILTRVRNPQM